MELSQTGILEVNLENKTESISIGSDEQIEKIVKALQQDLKPEKDKILMDIVLCIYYPVFFSEYDIDPFHDKV